mmetsp:Transcript_2969/g.8359  ORF Transcript_2969/g.8359 Transcript_2969/m.8359 type:complete len:162 (+) Transcript_2969:749-1234(+)
MSVCIVSPSRAGEACQAARIVWPSGSRANDGMCMYLISLEVVIIHEVSMHIARNRSRRLGTALPIQGLAVFWPRRSHDLCASQKRMAEAAHGIGHGSFLTGVAALSLLPGSSFAIVRAIRNETATETKHRGAKEVDVAFLDDFGLAIPQRLIVPAVAGPLN